MNAVNTKPYRLPSDGAVWLGMSAILWVLFFCGLGVVGGLTIFFVDFLFSLLLLLAFEHDVHHSKKIGVFFMFLHFHFCPLSDNYAGILSRVKIKTEEN